MQLVLLDRKASTHVLLVPLQRSAASSSQAPPWDVPVQLVVAEANASGGHAAEVPVQVPGTSHWPAAARQTVALDAKVQLIVQQDPGCPLFDPRSQSSPLPDSTTPLPHTWSVKTFSVTTWVASACTINFHVPTLLLLNAGQGPPPS